MATGKPSGEPSFLPVAASSSLGFGAMFGLAIRRRGGRQSMSALICVLVLGAVAMLAFPSVTDLIGGHRQSTVRTLFEKQLTSPQFKTTYRDHHVATGAGLTQLIINNPRVKVNVVVVEGTTVDALRAGAGHYDAAPDPTPYPCTPGNVGIAGHRTTYGRPFNRLNYMVPGDTVKLVTPVSQCVYRVVQPDQIVTPAGETKNPFVVVPTVQDVVSQDGVLGTGSWLTLTSCDPPGSDSHRLVLRLAMISCKGTGCPKGVTT